MPNDYRNESRRSAPAGRYGTPGTSYPTPNPYDVVITEEVANRAQAFEPVLYGTPHPTVVEAVLCHQGDVRGNSTDKAPVRVYANPRLAQETYNLVNGQSEANDPSYPVFVRSYLLPRGYGKGTMGTALTALIGLTLSAGGAGYAAGNESPGYGKVALAFSGGGGTGAAGWAECAAGAIVALVLTNTGTGYTSAPTVSASGGSGATIAALLQPTTAVLTKEDEAPAEAPYGGWFVRVTRQWETLPGPAIVTTKYDADSDTLYTEKRTLKLLSAITEGATKTGTTATITESEPVDALVGYELVKTFPDATANDVAHALTISEESAPFQFPATLDVEQYAASSGLIGYTKPFVRKVPHITKVFWVISNTKPVLADYLSLAQPASLFNYTMSGDPIGEVMYDTKTLYYSGITVTYPGSTPSLTEYLAQWVGGAPPAPRAVMGSVREAGSRYRWRVELVYVQYLVPALPTYS